MITLICTDNLKWELCLPAAVGPILPQPSAGSDPDAERGRRKRERKTKNYHPSSTCCHQLQPLHQPHSRYASVSKPMLEWNITHRTDTVVETWEECFDANFPTCSWFSCPFIFCKHRKKQVKTDTIYLYLEAHMEKNKSSKFKWESENF